MGKEGGRGKVSPDDRREESPKAKLVASVMERRRQDGERGYWRRGKVYFIRH